MLALPSNLALTDLTPTLLRKLFFFGVNLVDENGAELDDGVLEFNIQSAISTVENWLTIAIRPEEVTERQDYRQDVWRSFSFIQLRRRPIVSVSELSILFGEQRAYTAPTDWFRIEKRMGQLHLFPSLGAFAAVPLLGLTALTPMLLKTDWAPQVHEIKYTVGMESVDFDLAEAILTWAAISVFNIMGDIVIGPGIAGFSQSLDGLSQSIQTTASAEHSAYGARITLYIKRLFGDRIGDPGLIHALRSKWRIPGLAILAVTFMCLFGKLIPCEVSQGSTPSSTSVQASSTLEARSTSATAGRSTSVASAQARTTRNTYSTRGPSTENLPSASSSWRGAVLKRWHC